MRIRLGSAALLGLALVLNSCSDSGPVSPGFALRPTFAAASSMPAVRISEIHYDHVGIDTMEVLEISGPAGTSLAGYSVVLYNGSGGAVYNTRALTGSIPATCGSRGVVTLEYPTDGLQNGAPDGIALVGPAGLIEFLSYEGAFTGVGGAAGGVRSTDIGVAESNTTPVLSSLERSGADAWNVAAQHSFGTCNDAGEVPPAQVESVTVSPGSAAIVAGATQAFTATAYDASNAPVAGTAFTWTSTDTDVATVDASGTATGKAAGQAMIIAATADGARADTAALSVTNVPPPVTGAFRLNEIHYDDAGTDVNEKIEIEGPIGASLAGWQVVLYTASNGTVYSTTTLPAGAIAQQGDRCVTRGVHVVSYPVNGIQNGGGATPEADGFALVTPAGAVVEFLSYEGSFAATAGPAAGMTSTDIGVRENGEPDGLSLQRDTDGSWFGPVTQSFGACNPPKQAVEAPITFSGRTPGDPALPVGFQDQIFATLRDANGTVVPTTFTWKSETPSIADIDARGVMTALAAGSAILRATAADGQTKTYTLPTRVAVQSTTAQYGVNADFGIPADADASDDFVHTARDQYVFSFNRTRGTPNWVSYNIDATHFGPEDRCDCFTFDPVLPADFPRYTTADYTGAGDFHGYGIDRGHLARSVDREAGSLDNATTYYFSNIIPQAADNNQGPWASLESWLGNFAQTGNHDVFVVAGVAGSRGTLKNEGKIVIPEYTWKVAVIMPRSQGVNDVRTYADLDRIQYVAVVMPNVAGIRNVPWETYKVTVDSVEALSGYDLLDRLPDHLEAALESDRRPPVAALNGPYASDEGSVVAFDASASTDRDADIRSYEWSFGDGVTSGGVAATHTYNQDGRYTVRLVVTDARGFADTVTSMATVSNVAPVVSPFAGATLLPGETYSASGSFADPGADSWSGTVSYGDGTATSALALSGQSFTLTHTYNSAGSFTVNVGISDDDVTSGGTATVTVLTHAQAVQDAIALVRALVDAGTINAGNGNSLIVKLQAAGRALARDGDPAQLEALLNELAAMAHAGRLTTADAEPLRTLVTRIIRSASL